MKSLSLTICWMLAAAAALGQEPALRITHGPILGRPGAAVMGVWARTSRPGAFRVRYGLAPGELDRVSETEETRIERDNTGWVRLAGLRPGTRYFYRVMAGEDEIPGPGGSFRTLPDPASFRHPELNPRGLFNIRFEFGCGNNQAPAQGCGPDLPAFRTMLERHRDEVQFAILNGDWLYEERREFPAEEWGKQAGLGEGEMPDAVRIAPTIAGVWENYKLYLERGKNLAAWHREIPSYFTFDDHEILNDIWGAGTAGLRDRRAVFRDIGIQAWYDYLGWSNPVEFTQGIRFGEARLESGSDVLHDPRADFTRLDLAQAANLNVHWGGPTAGVNDNALDGVGGDPNAGVYDIVEVLGRDRLRIHPPARADGAAAYSIGRRNYCRFRAGNCDFFLLDTRSHREMHDIEHPAKPGLTMLGRRQREWLLAEMERSDADFLFVVSSVNLMVPHVGGGAIRPGGKDEAWTVFLDERERLIDFWDGLGRPVVEPSQNPLLDSTGCKAAIRRRASSPYCYAYKASSALLAWRPFARPRSDGWSFGKALSPHRRPAQQLRNKDYRPRLGIRFRPAQLPEPHRRRRGRAAGERRLRFPRPPL